MAEQEIIEHTKKIYKLWSNKELSFWTKFKEFIFEVFIIVFAITLSLWLHNESEHAHQQADVKQFLLGLKKDLTSDLAQIKVDKNSYLRQQALFTYIVHVKPNGELSPDSLRKYEVDLSSTTELEPNDGRFEGFKSSGKIGGIENNVLQNDIMDLYQEDIANLLVSCNAYIRIKGKLFDFIVKNQQWKSDSSTNLLQIMTRDEAKNLCIALSLPTQILQRYDACADRMKKIIAEINKTYHLNG